MKKANNINVVTCVLWSILILSRLIFDLFVFIVWGWGGATLFKKKDKKKKIKTELNLGGGCCCSSSSSEDKVITETGRGLWELLSSFKLNWNVCCGIKWFVVKRRLNNPTNDGGINNWLHVGF